MRAGTAILETAWDHVYMESLVHPRPWDLDHSLRGVTHFGPYCSPAFQCQAACGAGAGCLSGSFCMAAMSKCELRYSHSGVVSSQASGMWLPSVCPVFGLLPFQPEFKKGIFCSGLKVV